MDPQHPEMPQIEASDMPPLEDDEAEAASSRGSHSVVVAGGGGGGGGGGDGGASDTFLILDLPKNSTVGCDAKAIGIGTSDFKGIRAIPPGPHFIWVSAPNAMSRSGYWFVTGEGRRGRVRAKQWDRFDEALVQPAGVLGDVAGLSPQLVPYGFAGDEDAARLWPRLTSAIGEKLLGRVTAAQPSRDDDGDDGDDAPEWPVDTSDSASGDEPGPGGLDFLFPEGDVDLAAIDHDTNTNTNTATATTTPDTTASILRLVDHPGAGVTGADLVGEVQFAFLTGLHLSSLSCVGQWWHLVLRVVLRAHGLALARPALARALIQTLHAQMVYNERYIAGGPGGSATTTTTTTTTTTAATTTTGGDGDGEEGGEGPEYAQQLLQERVRHEYGGTDAQGTSILDIVPGNKRRLREALALFKRRLDEALSAGGPAVTDEQRAVGRAFSDLEAWLWRFGWDLTVDAAEGRRKGAGDDGDEDDDGYDDDSDGDYQPVIVDLDENGREVGLVSFN